jgi:hypothetical protein
MKSPFHTRLQVLTAALQVCPALANSDKKQNSVYPDWEPIIERMKVLAKADKKEAKLLSTFETKIGIKVHDAEHMARTLNGDWMEVLSKVLNAVVSLETKKKRLNCATCDPADFPVLLAVIQAMAWGAPSQMWGNSEITPSFVGLPDFDRSFNGPYKNPEPPASHRAIADKTWYRPQLIMLVTSIWPVALSLDYYESTLCHILEPGPDIFTEIETGMVSPPDIVGIP